MSSTDWGSLMKLAETAGGGEPIPPGVYDAEVEDAEYTVASTGSDMYKVKFRIVSGPHADRRQYTNIVLKADSPGSVSYFFQHMKALGLGPEFFAATPAPSKDAVADAIIGAPCVIKLKRGKPYKGQEKSEVDEIKPRDGGAGGAGVPAIPTTPAPAAPTATAEEPATGIPTPAF